MSRASLGNMTFGVRGRGTGWGADSVRLNQWRTTADHFEMTGQSDVSMVVLLPASMVSDIATNMTASAVPPRDIHRCDAE